MKQQQGFTLIELIVVIVILGILAATALPKFANLQADARLAKTQGVRAAVQSAAALAHSAQLVLLNAGAASSVTLDGQVVTMVNSYPTADPAGIDAAAGGFTDYSATGGGAGAGAVRTIATDTGHATCSITYTAPAAANTSPTISASPLVASC